MMENCQYGIRIAFGNFFCSYASTITLIGILSTLSDCPAVRVRRICSRPHPTGTLTFSTALALAFMPRVPEASLG